MGWSYKFAPALVAASMASAGAQNVEQGPPDPGALSKVVSSQIFFPKSSAYLRKAEAEKVRAVASALGHLPGQTLAIHGLTDPYGDPDFNDWLRTERSSAVQKALLAAGVDESRLRLAEPLPLSPADKGQPSSKLRRVEFSIDGLTVERVPGADGEGSDTPVGLAVDGTNAEATEDHGPPHAASIALVSQTQIFFPKSSAYLRNSEAEKLRVLAGALARLPGQVLSVRGLTDPRGNPAFNDWLRNERSGAVKKRLIALGVPAARMADGAPRATAGGAVQTREQQRRVEFGIEGLYAGDASLEEEAAEITALTPAQPPPPPRYGTIGRRDRERLGDVIAIADATQVHFEFAGFRVRREYHRELWSLASAILDTDDGAVSLRSYAAHGLPADDREEVGKRRALSVAAMLQQMGVEWQRIRIEDEVGVSDPDARPSWRDHRVEFSAIRTLPPGDSTSEELAASGGATGVELDATVAGSDDPLATLVADTIIYFGGNSAKVRLSDKRKLKRIAEYALKEGEARTIAVTAVTDRWGNAEYNRTLGRRRQAAVLNLLHDAGVPTERAVEGEIQTTPAGESGPSWKQRRAELELR